jgi:hypothetical protein
MQKAVQNSNDPYIGLLLAICLVGIIVFWIALAIKDWRKK